ncbi:MAG: hypothetical protein BWY26_00278 [Elusimicrobia bacterium ADurb.Bin231]|nr:MAG: hypothetical protein BWY26_00278 [Elusimicrobia bacterium ADurb.Bin231]
MKTNFKGQLTIAMLILSVIVAIVIPALFYLMQDDVKQAIRGTKSTRAFHLAEAGLDRAIYKMNESLDVWNTFSGGVSVTGFDGQTVYSDIEGGYYKIHITSGPDEEQVTVISSGKDKLTDECRTIVAVFHRPLSVEGGVSATTISANGNVEVHWGPIRSLATIRLKGSASHMKYPRKYARGYIEPRYDSGPLPQYGSLADEELAEWHAGYDVPDFPDMNFQEYEELAKQVTGAPSGGSPAGSSYYAGNMTFNNNVDYTSRVYYIMGDCNLKNSHLEGTLIVRGNLTTSGTEKGADTIATVPTMAWKEYQEEVTDTSAADQYPGDGGYRVCVSSYNIGQTLFNGFMYVGGTWIPVGGNDFYGAVLTMNEINGHGTPTIWYDKDCVKTVKTTSMLKLERISWYEIRGKWDI